MVTFLKNMFNIKNVIVDSISLVSKGKRPAVSQAETRFAIFKIAQSPKLSSNTMEKLNKISEKYEEIKRH